MNEESRTVSMRTGKPSQNSRTVLGWREWVALPALGIEAIKAKLDTGARTSSLHAFRIRPYLRDGIEMVEFRVHPVQRRREPEVVCNVPVEDRRWVVSSNGQREQRIVIHTAVTFGSNEWPIEITLTDRDQMGFRMLLGREALRRRAVVDPGRSFCMGRKRTAR